MDFFSDVDAAVQAVCQGNIEDVLHEDAQCCIMGAVVDRQELVQRWHGITIPATNRVIKRNIVFQSFEGDDRRGTWVWSLDREGKIIAWDELDG